MWSAWSFLEWYYGWCFNYILSKIVFSVLVQHIGWLALTQFCSWNKVRRPECLAECNTRRTQHLHLSNNNKKKEQNGVRCESNFIIWYLSNYMNKHNFRQNRPVAFIPAIPLLCTEAWKQHEKGFKQYHFSWNYVPRDTLLVMITQTLGRTTFFTRAADLILYSSKIYHV